MASDENEEKQVKLPTLASETNAEEKAQLSPSEIAEQKKQARVQEQENARDRVQQLWKGGEGSSLRAWLKHFDRNHDMKITFREFCLGMVSMNFKGNATDLFTSIDIDGSGELSLDEIEVHSNNLWSSFRSWCVEKFASASDFIMQVQSLGSTEKRDSLLDFIKDKKTFAEGIRRCGWDQGHEDVLFESIDCSDAGCVTKSHLKWFETDKENQKRKQDAKKRSNKDSAKKGREQEQIKAVMDQFKAFLKQKYGCYLRAWRRGLDLDGSMSVQKAELFKACKDMAWSGDIRLLWKALDRDASGVTALEELDIDSAEQLAKFKAFTMKHFGSATACFKVWDSDKSGKLSEKEFVKACKKHGFDRVNKALYMGLDHENKKYVLEKDLAFLDQWKPQPYLTCQPNKQAADNFKDALMRVYRNFVKAWRVCLDRDNSNVVNWQEFQEAAKRIRFKGDVAGAWRYLDNDLGGFITLAEIDKDASDVLMGFKLWCNEEFGGVRSAFSTFDSDGSGEVNFSEFRTCCLQYQYKGNAKSVFNALDTDGQGLLAFNEISFLDDWELPPEPKAELPPVEEQQLVPSEKDLQKQKERQEAQEAQRKQQELYLKRLALPKLRGMTKQEAKIQEKKIIEDLAIPQYSGPYRWTAKASRERLMSQLSKRPFIGL